MSHAPSAPEGARPVTVWITGDQCSIRNSALAGVDPATTTVLLIESVERGATRPYHKRKLVLIYSVMRHFADELRATGWTVDYHAESPSFQDALTMHLMRYRPQTVRMMQQSEWGMNERYASLLPPTVALEVTPHANVISEAFEFDRLFKSDEARVTMETFYRAMRKKTGLLMDGTQPVGGAWNYDAENRSPAKPGTRFPEPPRFEPDAITRAVIAMVERHFADHPGIVGDFHLPVTRAQALAALDDFVTHRLDGFGVTQDAMLTGERNMSHSLLSSSINTMLLHPLEVAERAELAYRSGIARLSSVEGFIRQVIGWREYIWRVYWRMMPEYRTRNALGADLPVPSFYWNGETQMFCLREALAHVRETAYAHHILRLMVLGNFALIAGLEPVAVNDWFWAMFIDGYDWVMVPNVIGMSLHADGGFVGTKPYAASANYIDRMSDYCRRCPYDPKTVDRDDSCPYNALYWDFIDRHEARFSRNMRMRVIVRNWQGRDTEKKTAIRARARALRERIRRDERF